MTPRKIGVIGPGAIGGPLAARLSQAGHDVRLRGAALSETRPGHGR
jgi:ketopantoate reductase